MGASRRALAITLLIAGALPALHGCGVELQGEPGTLDGASPQAPAEVPAPGPAPAMEPAPVSAEAPQAPPQAPSGEEAAALGPGIQVSFLAPGSTPGEDRWVTAATFTRVGEGPGLQIRARVRRVDPDGSARDILGLWDADDLFALSARFAHEVTLTVLRTGDGSLVARDRGGSRRIAVVATQEGSGWTVRFSQ